MAIAAAMPVDTAAGSASVDTAADTLAAIVVASASVPPVATRAAIAVDTLADSMAEQQAAASTAGRQADFMVAEVVAPTAVADTGNLQQPNTTRPALRSRPSCF
jgi:hypothetical protein